MSEDIQINKAIDKAGNVQLANLSTDELQKYQTLADAIDESNPNAIINYASELQNMLSSQSDIFLSNVRKSQTGEVGSLINEMLAEINYVDVDELDQNFFQRFIAGIPILRKLAINIKNIFAKYDTILNNVNAIGNKVKAGIINTSKDNAMLQTVFDSNVEGIKQLEDYIIAGNLRMQKAQEELKLMQNEPDNYQDYQISDKSDFISRLDRRLANLKIVRMTMMQSLPQIRLIQNNNISIAEKAQTILTTTLPLWKNQLTLAVAMHRQKQHIEIQRKISDTTEEILRKNAEQLGQNSREVAKANEETIVSIDTLRKTTNTLISTLSEVKDIQIKGMQSRRQLDNDLQLLEQELRTKLKNI